MHWNQIQLRSQITQGCAVALPDSDDDALPNVNGDPRDRRRFRGSLSKASHRLAPKNQLSLVLVVATTSERNVRGRVFSTARPGHLMMELQVLQ